MRVSIRYLLLAALAVAVVATATGAMLSGPALALSTGDGGWQWQDPLPQGNNLETVSALDSQHAVAAGDNGTVLTTSDGGASWAAHDIGIAGAHVADLSFVDANDGWAAVWVQPRNVGPYRALILHTTDGGATWAKVGFPWHPEAVDFVDASHGWVCGGNTVWSTADGGLTWSARNLAQNLEFNDVAFIDDSHGWVVGFRSTDHGSYNDPIILATTNGGASWHEQSFPSGEGELYSVSFVTADRGWALGNGTGDVSGAIVLATTDGGATWSPQSLATSSYLSGATFVDAAHGWLAGGSDAYATTDGGATWTSQAVGMPISAISFADDLNGYAVGPSGGIATTTDGGASWHVHGTTMPTEGIPGLSDIAFPDATNGWAVGDHVILATTDSGATWTSQAASTILAGVSFPDAVHGWAVGGGVVLHTSDGGSSWQTQNESKAHTLTDVEFVDAEHGWAAGSDGGNPAHPVVGATSDGGVDWKFVELPHVYGVANAVSFVDAKHGWVVCSRFTFPDTSPSMIFTTSDGGLTWKRQYIARTEVALCDITFVDGRHGWAVGQTNDPKGICLVLTTTDGGATWTRQNLTAQNGGRHVTFTDARHGWVVCGPTVLATVDGGRHWWTERAGSEVGAVAFTDPSHGWAVAATGDWTGGGGGILTTTTGGFGSAPVTTVSGADSLWHRRAVHLKFTAADEPGGPGMIGGQAKIETRVDGGPWTTTGGALTIGAPVNHANDGVHLVFYRATDSAGNTEEVRNVVVRIDTRGPTTVAQAAVGTSGHAITLRYFIADLCPRAAAVRLTVSNAAGVVIKRFAPGATNTNVWLTLKWRPSLKGRYSYSVYARDLAGNAQAKVGRAGIKVE
jgi:photosystem II stability/assembly factor-like uncharacterized protein